MYNFTLPGFWLEGSFWSYIAEMLYQLKTCKIHPLFKRGSVYLVEMLNHSKSSKNGSSIKLSSSALVLLPLQKMIAAQGWIARVKIVANQSKQDILARAISTPTSLKLIVDI